MSRPQVVMAYAIWLPKLGEYAGQAAPRWKKGHVKGIRLYLKRGQAAAAMKTRRLQGEVVPVTVTPVTP